VLYEVQQYTVSQPGCQCIFNSNACYTHSTIVHKVRYNQQDLAPLFILVDDERKLRIWLNCVLVYCEKGGGCDKELTLTALDLNAAVPKTSNNLRIQKKLKQFIKTRNVHHQTT
jgi:hypothetical protein